MCLVRGRLCRGFKAPRDSGVLGEGHGKFLPWEWEISQVGENRIEDDSSVNLV